MPKIVAASDCAESPVALDGQSMPACPARSTKGSTSRLAAAPSPRPCGSGSSTNLNPNEGTGCPSLLPLPSPPLGRRWTGLNVDGIEHADVGGGKLMCRIAGHHDPFRCGIAAPAEPVSWPAGSTAPFPVIGTQRSSWRSRTINTDTGGAVMRSGSGMFSKRMTLDGSKQRSCITSHAAVCAPRPVCVPAGGQGSASNRAGNVELHVAWPFTRLTVGNAHSSVTLCCRGERPHECHTRARSTV